MRRTWLTRKIARWLELALRVRKVTQCYYAINKNPTQVNPRLALVSVLMLYPKDLDCARRAKGECEVILALDPNKEAAVLYLATLIFREARALTYSVHKFRKLDESASWYEKALVIDPRNKEAHFSLGVINWLKLNTELLKARESLGMQSNEPGPLRDPAIRTTLREYLAPTIEQGISRLQKALDINPDYADAMVYMGLMVRGRADLADSAKHYRLEIQTADEWTQKANSLRPSRGRR